MQTIHILHGWAIGERNQEKWQPFIDLLQKVGFKVRFLKIPGLSTPLNESWQLQDFVNWLEGELEGQENIILLGHSFGGQLSIRYISLHPGQISRLILLDTGGIRDRDLKIRIKRGLFLVLAKTGKNFLKAPIFRKLLYKMARETDYLKAPPAQRKSMSNVLSDEIRVDLEKVDCPTQIIWGKNDTTTPLKNAYLVQEEIPQSQLNIVEEARHSPMFTHPEEVSKIIIKFLVKAKK